MGKYDDIINMNRPVSAKHPPMPLSDRAAQFSPFAALTGYDAAIQESARLTEDAVELDESVKALVNEKLSWISEHIHEQPEVTITYFQPDERKSGGRYVDFSGVIKKLDVFHGNVVMTDETIIQVDMIKDIRISR